MGPQFQSDMQKSYLVPLGKQGACAPFTKVSSLTPFAFGSLRPKADLLQI
jgi:hypothetical protein